MPVVETRLGKNVEIYHSNLANIYGCEIGDGTKIGPFVEIQKGVVVGKNCKIQSHTFICDGVTIQDDVFIGHGVMFTNDKHPKVIDPNWRPEPTLVKRGASIGTNATILSGLVIGENALIGAGAVVTCDVPDKATVIGNPARIKI